MKTILKILLIIILSAITIVAGTDPQAMVSECAQIKSTGITIPDLERWGGNFVLGAGIVIVGVSAFVDSAFNIFGGTPLDTDAFDNAGYGAPPPHGRCSWSSAVYFGSYNHSFKNVLLTPS